MPRVRDLPIAAKLALSAGSDLLLLGALTWDVRASMARVDALDRQSAASEQAARAITTVRRAENEMRVVARELIYQQSAPAADATISRADQQRAPRSPSCLARRRLTTAGSCLGRSTIT